MVCGGRCELHCVCGRHSADRQQAERGDGGDCVRRVLSREVVSERTLDEPVHCVRRGQVSERQLWERRGYREGGLLGLRGRHVVRGELSGVRGVRVGSLPEHRVWSEGRHSRRGVLCLRGGDVVGPWQIRKLHGLRGRKAPSERCGGGRECRVR